MTKKNLLSVAGAALFAALCLNPTKVSAQSPPPNANNNDNGDSLQMVVDYGQGNQKHRESHHGVIDPVGLPVGQQVGITLNFLRKRAGQFVLISALDGGELNVPQPSRIASDGSFTFQFRGGNLPGVYRLLINGESQYQVSLYGYDPNHPPGRGNKGANH